MGIILNLKKNFSDNFFGIKNPEIDLLAFSIHTYYSILLNFIALKLGSSFSKDLNVAFILINFLQVKIKNC